MISVGSVRRFARTVPGRKQVNISQNDLMVPLCDLTYQESPYH